jgi:hypothetical protein
VLGAALLAPAQRPRMKTTEPRPRRLGESAGHLGFEELREVDAALVLSPQGTSSLAHGPRCGTTDGPVGCPRDGHSLTVMRAVQITRFGGPEVLDVVDLPDPVPGDGQELYDVSTAGINYADTHHRLSHN